MRQFARHMLRAIQSERGLVGLDAGVLIGGLVAASALVGGVVLASGMSASDQLGATVQSALDRTGTGLMLDGPVIARTDGEDATNVLIDVMTLPGSKPVSLVPADLDVEYVSSASIADHLPFAVVWASGNDGALSDGERARIELRLDGLDGPPASGERFTLILRSRNGEPLRIELTMPAMRPLDAVVVLN